MQALTFHGPGRVRCETVPDPVLRGPDEALVRVTTTAICGSDLHPYRGREKGLDPGTVLGHEFVGVVEEATAEAPAVGQRVAAPFSTSCGDCFFCRRGLTSRCERGQLFGWIEEGDGLHGGQAELVRVPLARSSLTPIPEGVSDEAALLAGDVLSTGFYCAEMAEVSAGDRVAVIGCGPVGLMAILAARELGAERVLAIDTVAERRELAAGLGAEAVDPAAGEAVERVREATSGRGADAVLEAVGSPQASRLAIDLVRPGGTVAAAGFHTESRFAFGPGEAYDKNLTYRAGRCPARHYLGRLLPRLA
ncbi:MAG: alcohol dehydrogenase catalytic domain-containing protein, partial [Thermoanaerobaculia bacterium]|nr:alcohol dehydrogenase catalytic domain-containing protein [Thermoanaerobaculia bacterium]